MNDRISEFFSSNYMPHGMCYMWKPELLWLNVLSDAVIAISYFTIPIGIYYFMKKRKDLEFRWIFLLFSLFIAFCGLTHVIGIYVVWNGTYGIHGLSKFLTATVSAATAYYLYRSIPLALSLPSPQQLSHALESAHKERIQRIEQEKAIERDTALRESTEGAHVGIAVVNDEGIIIISNKALNTMFKYEAGALEGQSINVLLPEHLVEDHENMIRTYIASDRLDINMAAGRNLEGVAKTGERVPIEVRLHKGTDDKEPVIYASITDLTERNKIKQMLIESNERFTRITESAAEGLWEINFNDDALWLSPNVFEFPQTQSEDAKEYFNRWLERVDETYREDVREYFYGHEQDTKSEPFVFPLRSHDGGQRWHVARAGNVYKNGRRIYRSGTLLDIHERRNLENLLRKEEALNQSIISLMPIGLHMYSLNPHGQLIFQRFNDAAADILDIDHKPLIGKTLVEAFPALEGTDIAIKCHEIAKSGGYFENENIIYQDEEVEGVFAANYFQATEGTMISLFRDISASRKAEIALREQERFISRAMNATFAGIYIYNVVTSQNEFINEAYTRILGYTKEDLSLLSADEFNALFHPEDVDSIHEHIGHVLGSKSEADVFKVEYRFRHKHGHWVWCLSHDTVFEFAEDGTVSKFVGSFIDITQRKNTEIALQDSEKRYETMAKGAGVGIWDWRDIENGILIWSDRFVELLGYKTDEIEVDINTFTNLLHPQDRDSIWQAIQTHLDSRETYDVEYRLKCKDGNYRWYRATGMGIFDEDGKANRMVGSLESIQDRKDLESEQKRLLEILELGTDYIGQLNAQKEVVFLNKAFLGLVGARDEKGLSIEQWHTNESLEIINHELFPSLLANHYWRGELDVVDYRGNDFPVSVSAMAHIGEDGEPEYFTAVFRDIREIKHKEQELNTALRKLELVTDGSTDGFWHWLDPENDIVEWSDRFYQLIGYPPQSFTPSFKYFQQLLHPDDLETTLNAVETSVKTQRPFDIQYRIKNSEGGYQWFRARGKPYFKPSGEFVEMAGAISDIANIKALEQQLLESNQELEQFAYIASHDLKEPVRTLRTFSAYLVEDMRKNAMDRVEQDVDYIKSASARMTKLIDDLLEFSRAGNVNIKKSLCQLSDILNEIKEQLGVQISESQARIEAEFDIHEVYCDPTLFGLVLQNLAQNAIKFQPPGNVPKIHIRSSMTADGKHIQIDVTDNGIGMEEGAKALIFGIFKTLHASSEYPGTGIGLAIVQKIIQRHGGSIDVLSKIDKGTTFSIKIPHMTHVSL